MSEHSAERDAPSGAWIVYSWDHGPYAISLHATCEDAVRSNAGSGYGSIGFWPFGVEFGDAIKAWEERVTPPAEGRAMSELEQATRSPNRDGGVRSTSTPRASASALTDLRRS